jgi:opacity protein-like surface antigen
LEAGVLATPSLLLKLSGGPALAQIKTQDAFTFAYINNLGTPGGSSSGTANTGGYWVGAGTEYALPNSRWRLKLEYAYMSFSNVNTTTTWLDTTSFCNSTRSPTGCVNTFTNGRRVTDNSVLVGFNYAFAPAPVPVPIITK